MTAFSPTDAAFEGFRLTREQPRVVAAWAALYTVGGLGLSAVTVVAVGPQFATFQSAAQRGDFTEAGRQFESFAPFCAVILPLVLAFWSILTCAVYRVVLRPDQGGIGRLRFGGDELRMMGLTALLWLLTSATIFLAALFVSFGGIMAATGGGVLGGLLTTTTGLVGFGLAIWVWVRLSLAGPMTFVTGEIHIFRSWSLTKGHFWRLVGAYLLAFALAFVVTVLAAIIFNALAHVVVLMTGGSFADLTRAQPNASSIAAYFTPVEILGEVFSAVLRIVVYAVVLSPAAVIYAALTGHPVHHGGG